MSSFRKQFTALFLALALLFSWHPLILAADIRTNESVVVTDGRLNNPYLFGERVEVTVPVTNDLVAAGGNLFLNGPVSGSILASGGNLNIKGSVENSVRVAGGTITIDGPINQDLLVFAGTTTITKNATISGDVIFFGGQLQVDGSVLGTIHANGGDITINNRVGRDVKADAEILTFGPQASVSGNVIYEAPNEAIREEGSVINGEIDYTQADKDRGEKKGLGALFAAGTLYKLIADFLFVLLFILITPRLSKNVVETINEKSLKSLGIGFVTLLFVPIAGLFLLLVIWLGISSFVLYGFLLLLALAFTKLFVGWKTLSWWYTRSNKRYTLDWRTAPVGVVIVFALGLIPIIGWLAAFVLFLMALGGLVLQLFTFISTQAETKSAKRK